MKMNPKLRERLKAKYGSHAGAARTLGVHISTYHGWWRVGFSTRVGYEGAKALIEKALKERG